MDTSGVITVRDVEPATFPRLAVIVELPLLKTLADPIEFT
jgi:hypothetical protein